MVWSIISITNTTGNPFFPDNSNIDIQNNFLSKIKALYIFKKSNEGNSNRVHNNFVSFKMHYRYIFCVLYTVPLSTLVKSGMVSSMVSCHKTSLFFCFVNQWPVSQASEPNLSLVLITNWCLKSRAKKKHKLFCVRNGGAPEAK